MNENEIVLKDDNVLLNELELEKTGLKEMLVQLESMNEAVKKIMPNDPNDFKSRFNIENKMKVVLGYYDAILNLRKQIIVIIEKQLTLKNKHSKDSIDYSEIISKITQHMHESNVSTKDNNNDNNNDDILNNNNEDDIIFGSTFPNDDIVRI